MKDGLIKAAVGTPEIRVADCAYNAASAAAAARRAAMEGVRILALPELCLTGYTCGDLFLQDTLIEGAYAALETVRRETEDLDMLLAVGLPVMWHGKLYNCAAVLCRGEVLGLVPKTHLPNYGEYYEKRWFAPAPEENGYLTGVFGEDVIPFGAKQLFHCEELPGLVLGVEVCEDLWAPCPPSITLAQAGATVLVNLSAGDETVGKAAYRRELVKNQSARLVCGYLYANAGEGESTTDMVFSGHGLIAEDGALLAEKPPFTGGFAVTDLDIGRITAERRRLTTFPAAVREGYLEQHLLPLPMRDAAHPDGAAVSLPAFAGGTGRLLRAGPADPVARACTAARPLGREDRRRGHLGRARFGARPARGGARGRSARPSARQRAGGDNARLRHDRSHEGQRGTPLRTARRELLLRGYRGRGRRALPRHRSGPRPARRDL